jgi:hypothetical protein
MFFSGKMVRKLDVDRRVPRRNKFRRRALLYLIIKAHDHGTSTFLLASATTLISSNFYNLYVLSRFL